ncbi:glycoside hydrolase family 97 catalytic domain-containing protein [Belliella kenyensis]|uniref:Glycoside hydrolase family 97 catalytic domain-containing protein n=1 Tax=Belliella kenyensis TaxID=1472724 RepID=A0ABV8ES20_9BACT|nr:glycoside hydrolase family 97 protein [Belliella kenyensis]MCH7402033.1 glycoside hydrolase family 97 protein [Belliella kenyensis]MDN3605197.1 glycoside hydrolase family 97 catalytic domain-containing protein [Belliella kenyensis]
MKYTLLIAFIFISSQVFAQEVAQVASPDGLVKVSLVIEDGKLFYSVNYDQKTMLDKSPLGLETNAGSFIDQLSFVKTKTGKVDQSYNQDRIKKSDIQYKANTLTYTIKNEADQEISVHFQISDNDIAFRYELPMWKETKGIVVEKEITGFRFPTSSTAFLSNMMRPMTGFARTAPSYESGYVTDEPIDKTNARLGYVFPGLFKVGNDGWVLLSETGVGSNYTAAHLSGIQDGVYTVSYPQMEQNNGFGSTGAQLGLPSHTPWRTITLGSSLKPIVETTISYDVVEPLYEASQDYKYGKGTWSWIIWQDNSMNYEDQIKYIDMAAAMDFEYILIDAWWDERIGYDRMEELIQYANSKGVDVFLWYNSNGTANDAFQTPLNKMNTSIARKKEMKWLQKAGVKGLKVDFFGGDKQETLRLYEDILSDANEYGLMIIFHGATLPRGWERMYPNFVGSEAVLASEMLVFVQDTREKEAFYATLHPFIRNSVASMEFGGIILNKYLNRGNQRGQERLTTDIFQLATGVLFQNPVQMFGLTPNNLTDVPAFELEFLRKLPTTWDETIHIDGYPGKYSVIARRSGSNWYIAGVNAEADAKTLKLNLPMLKGKKISLYNDDKKREPSMKTIEAGKNGEVTVTIQSRGGFVLTDH